MSIVRTIWACTLSPRLFKVQETSWKSYEPNSFERWGDYVVTSFAAIWSISLYTLPIIATFMYRRGTSIIEYAHAFSRLAAGASFIFIVSLAVRGCARSSNPIYSKFIKTLTKARQAYNYETKQDLSKYDFEFWAWPEDFQVLSLDRPDGKKRMTLQSNSSKISRRNGDNFILAVPCKILSYVIANTVAIKLMYPGSASLINMVMKSSMLQGRIDLYERGGQRSKLITFEKNEIDTMFVDRRHRSKNGHILVITCEGNCGFYEAGIMSTPLNKEYSVLGWNHPGFGGSTGSPFPEQEIDAIDAVMRFAMEKLGFPEDRIILNGWSIGGFTSTWAAMNYQGINGLVLDATFDDVLPLAMNTMPSALSSIVRNVIRNYLNLNVAEQLKKYDGKVLLIRRTDDEIMCTPAGSLAHNRANSLLTKFLMHRYPQLFGENNRTLEVLGSYLAHPAHDANGKKIVSLAARTRGLFSDGNPINENICLGKIKAEIERNGNSIRYPSTLGEDCDSITKEHLVIYLASKYMEDQASQHCMPLNVELFQPGWDPRAIKST